MKNLLIITLMAMVGLITTSFSSFGVGDGTWFIKQDCYGTRVEEDLTQVYHMVLDEDRPALTEMLNNGDAYYLPAGTPVHVVNDSESNCKVRPVGSIKNWWVSGKNLMYD